MLFASAPYTAMHIQVNGQVVPRVLFAGLSTDNSSLWIQQLVLLKHNIQRTTSHWIPINAITSKFNPTLKKNTSCFSHKQPILYLIFHHPIRFQRTVVFFKPRRIAHRWSFFVYLVKPNLLETCTFCRPANLAEARLVNGTPQWMDGMIFGASP